MGAGVGGPVADAEVCAGSAAADDAAEEGEVGGADAEALVQHACVAADAVGGGGEGGGDGAAAAATASGALLMDCVHQASL